MDKEKGIINKIQDNARKMEILMGIILLLVVTLISCKMPAIMDSEQNEDKRIDENNKPAMNGRLIIVDPGHGGVDPGKIGINGDKEKEINLQISLILREELVSRGYEVLMTRETDEGLYESTDTNKKRIDMRNRCELINGAFEKKSDVINVSIHQNSFPSEGVYGPQVFYYSKSDKSMQLAKIFQRHMNEKLAIAKPRVEKSDDNYYMLVHTDCPSVIVECGFLSNYNESKLLSTNEYQSRMAKSICDGIDEYYAILENMDSTSKRD